MVLYQIFDIYNGGDIMGNQDVVTIFKAKKILTMNPLQPEAEVVAVQGEHIYAVGGEKGIVEGLKLAGLEYKIDLQFRTKVLVPGFIETHCHPVFEGLFWQWLYIGFDKRKDPHGKQQGGYQTWDAIIEALKEHEKILPAGEPLMAWGYDPALLDGFPTLLASDLDKISSERPIVVINMSGHLFYINSVALKESKITSETDVPGVIKDEKGNPTGELQEIEAASLAFAVYFKLSKEISVKALRDAARLAQSTGCTTIADLGIELIPGSWQAMEEVRHDPDFPLRLSGYVYHEYLNCAGGLKRLREMMAENDSRVRVSGVKFFTDGSIQGYTANMQWPYYYSGAPNGLPNINPENFEKEMQVYHDEGIQCATHGNGNGGIEEIIQTIQKVLFKSPKLDHRHRIEHCQTVTHPQLDKIAKLGICVSFFSNHIYYWGEFHKKFSLGPDRVKYLDPLASTAARGIPLSMHSDAHASPVDPLFCIWVGATRQSRTKEVIGSDECISVLQGLKAMTYDAAYILHEEDVKGSIEPTKLADFTVLDQDPLAIERDGVKDIKVVATVLGGKVITSEI